MQGRLPPSVGRSFRRQALALSIGGLLSASVRAEPPPASTPTPQPGTTIPTIIPRVIVAPSATPTLDPVRPNLPPTAGQDLSLTANPPLLREGAFISNARARLVKGKSGRWYAVYEPDGTGRMLPPMIVMENANLAAMEHIAAREPAGTHVRLSGRVTVYRDRNFLLPTTPPLIERVLQSDPEAASNAASTAASVAASSAAAASTTAGFSTGTAAAPGGKAAPGASPEPSIEQIIKDLDNAVGPRRQSAGGGSSAGGAFRAPSVTLVQEPTESGPDGFLTGRRARIVRGADGSLMATLDNGPSGRAEGPLVLLPCQNLTAIEATLDTGGESSLFTLSGDVKVYKGRRYLLPTMYTVVKPSDIIMPTH